MIVEDCSGTELGCGTGSDKGIQWPARNMYFCGVSENQISHRSDTYTFEYSQHLFASLGMRTALKKIVL